MIISYSDFVNKFLWRNNVIRGSIIMSLVMAFFMFSVTGFVFYYLDEKDDNVSNYVIPMQLSFVGINQLYEKFFSFISSFYIDFDNKRGSLYRFIYTFYKKSFLICFIACVIPISLFFEKNNLFFKLIELALLNMGIGVFIMLCTSAVFSGYLTSNTKGPRDFKKKEPITITFFIMWVLVWILFALDDYLVKEIGSSFARALIISIEIFFIMSCKLWIPFSIKIFIKNRYQKLLLYFSV